MRGLPDVVLSAGRTAPFDDHNTEWSAIPCTMQRINPAFDDALCFRLHLINRLVHQFRGNVDLLRNIVCKPFRCEQRFLQRR